MQIFDQEITDGLADKLSSVASISYASMASPCLDNKKNKHFKSIASFDDEDLYYVQSILVSSSWNKNDDIFDKTEVWNARHTPEHKPTNLEHNEDDIIGHIISNWPITEDGIMIDENTPVENLPDKYHILTGSVIYKGFSNPELRSRSEKLIAEIEQGTKYVSMECFFRGFDYGLINTSTGEYKILNRNNETAYLTKFLRAYGGQGQHDGYKIGRVLRNITFTGKGYVDKPANQDSIIFSKNMLVKTNVDDNNIPNQEKKDEITKSGVLEFQPNTHSENLTMSSTEKAVNETSEATQDCAEATAKAITIATEMSAQVAELKLAKEQLEADLAAVTLAKEQEITALKETASQVISDEITKLQTELAEAAKKSEEDKKAKDEEVSKLKAELDAANDVIAGYKMKEEEMAKKEKKMKRMASLTEMGFDTEAASATTDKFEFLDDASFEAMTSLFAAKTPSWLKKKEEEKKDKTEATDAPVVSDNTNPEVLEQAEENESVNLSVGDTQESAMDTTRAALVEFVYSKLGKKNNK